MQRKSVSALIQALNAADIRYLLVGGLAVVAHGYVRFTADVDVVLDLEDNIVRRASAALAGLGYRLRAPVALEDFIDPAARLEAACRACSRRPRHPAVDGAQEGPVR